MLNKYSKEKEKEDPFAKATGMILRENIKNTRKMIEENNKLLYEELKKEGLIKE